jgi:hypothetical protein
VSGLSLEDANLALQAAFVSEENGATTPPFEARTEIPLEDDTKLVAEVIQGYEQEADSVEGVIDNIDIKLREGVPVAMLYKKTTNPEDARMHWVLLTGYTYERDSDIVNGVEIMDPERDDKFLADPVEVVGMIARSMEAGGVFAYAMSVERPQKEERLAFVADETTPEGVHIEDEAIIGVIRGVIETQRAALITKGGKVAAIVMPTTVAKLVQDRIASDPEFAARLENPGEGIPVDAKLLDLLTQPKE